jgi:hypothetical protein
MPIALGAILLNPSTGAGSPTLRHLNVAARILGADDVSIANLFPIHTRSLDEIRVVGSTWESWLPARSELRRVISTADQILVGWGAGGLTGTSAQHLRRQIAWVYEALLERGCPVVSVGPDTRHPSRWHQYVSDRWGRTAGGTFEERLTQVLKPFDGIARGAPHGQSSEWHTP